MDTWINTLPEGLYLSRSWVAYPLITGEGEGPWDGHYQIRSEVCERADMVQGESQIGSANQLCLKRSCCSNADVQYLSIYFLSSNVKSLLIQGSDADYSSHIFHPWFSAPSLLEMQIRSVTNDVGLPRTRSSPWRPHVFPQLTSSSSTVITLVGSLRLIILDFGMLCHCLHLLAPRTALFWSSTLIIVRERDTYCIFC